jgi:hypothetical protein
MADDGCGHPLQCGTCPPCPGLDGGDACGTTKPNVCGCPACVPKTCAEQGLDCGMATDGFGHPLDCGSCPPCQVCGATKPNVCGVPACTPKTCAQQGFDCGMATDGCGPPGCAGVLDCGVCTKPGETCGGGWTPNVCATPCVPTTCAALGYACGQTFDGCNKMLDCGACPSGQACGAGGVDHQCSACISTCVPQTCASQGLMWGPAGDGCGDIILCGGGPCGPQPPADPSCWGALTNPPGAWMDVSCWSGCIPKTCAQQGIYCAMAGDGCGQALECGSCNPCGTCPVQPGECPGCQPRTCASLGFDCGKWDDGCGGMLDCGGCDPCISCHAGKCGGVLVSLCVPKTCAELGVACGGATDGCYHPIDCGACPPGFGCAEGKCLPACM